MRMLRLRRFSQVAGSASPASQRSADSASMDNEAFERVRRTVRALPPKYREAVVLKYLEALPTDQIAQILGISKNTLQVRLNRARKRLKDNLADLMESNP